MCECWSRRKQTLRVCIILLHHWWLDWADKTTYTCTPVIVLVTVWHLLIQCVNEVTSWMLTQRRLNNDKTKFVVLKSPAGYSMDIFYNQQMQPRVWADTLTRLTLQLDYLLSSFPLWPTAICSSSAESGTEFCSTYLVLSNLETVSHDSVTVWVSQCLMKVSPYLDMSLSHECHSAWWQCHCASWCDQMCHGIVAVVTTLSQCLMTLCSTSWQCRNVWWHCHYIS